MREGQRLRAEARELTRGATIATYGVAVTRDDGRAVSTFTGTVYVLGTPHDAGASTRD